MVDFREKAKAKGSGVIGVERDKPKNATNTKHEAYQGIAKLRM
jgi:hypothetical protein